jgi:branched-chain amino acid transport system ATP-binding protein
VIKMLRIENVTKQFGGLKAINNVTFSVKEGEVIGLIGPNGAGKTTLVNLISGVYNPDHGLIKFNNIDITNLPSNSICRAGIARTFQIPQPFEAMTALYNVTVGVLNGKVRDNMSISDAVLEASYYLEFVGLFSKRETLASELTLYELRMLELARALATTPKLLLIDEAMAGLNPGEAFRALEMIQEAREQFGVTILWIEHVMEVIMNAAERIVVLHYGEKIFEGTPREVSSNDVVIKSYLGDQYAYS